MSDTPRTDEAESTYLKTPHYHVVGSVFARQLERELAEAKRVLRGILDNDGWDRPKRPLTLAVYRDEAKAILGKGNG